MNDVNSRKLSVRIVKVDYYLAKPIAELNDPCYSGFRSLPIHHVPVIRIFGPTSEGVKACVHIHGAFPYIFIPNWNNEIGEKDLYHFASSLDKAINTSFAYSSSKAAHVYRITSVLGRPFYGYHEDEKQFLKIEFYNPAIIKRAADLLLNRAVFNNNFQPYEAHVPYILQFFIDHNLYGMNYVTLSSYRTRHENPADCESAVEPSLSSPYGVPKQSYTFLEVDSFVSSVINEFENADDMPKNPGLAFIWEEERKRRRLQHRVSQITPNMSQIRPETISTRSEQYYMSKLMKKLIRFKASQEKNVDNVENNSVVLEEDEVNSSYEELNTQSRSILELLEKMVNTGSESARKTDPNESPPSSPSIVFSDDEMEPLPSLSSQPLLKLPAEDDSILGTNFSDDDVDEDDHLMLSQSLFQNRPSPIFSGNESEGEEIESIDQLDGASGGTSPPRNKGCKNDRKAIAKKQENQAKRVYNLRSRDTLPPAVDSEETRKSAIRKVDLKISPKKVYPQLQIDTQKSPRSAPRVSAEEPSAVEGNYCPSPEFFVTSYAPEKLLSPSSSFHSEGRRSESKRPYPQLDVNIKTSPRTGVKSESEEESRSKNTTKVLKKRKIDFDVGSDSANFDMTLMTTRWKQQFRSKEKKGAESSCELSNVRMSDRDHGDRSAMNTIGACTPEIEDTAIRYSQVPTFTISNEIGSQKYSLKIRLDTCGSVDERELLKDLLTKKAVVKIEKMEMPDSDDGRKLPNDSEYLVSKGEELAEDSRSSINRSVEDEPEQTNQRLENEFLKNEQPVRETRSRIRSTANARNSHSPALSSQDTNGAQSSESSQTPRRPESKSSSEVDFFDQKKNKESSELDFFGEKNISPVLLREFESSIKRKMPFSDDPLSSGSSVAPSIVDDGALDTVILSRSSGTSESSSSSFPVANLRVVGARISRSQSNNDDFPSWSTCNPDNKSEHLDIGGYRYSEIGDDQFTQSYAGVKVSSAPGKDDQKMVVLSKGSGISEDGNSSFPVADLRIPGAKSEPDVTVLTSQRGIGSEDFPTIDLRVPNSETENSRAVGEIGHDRVTKQNISPIQGKTKFYRYEEEFASLVDLCGSPSAVEDENLVAVGYNYLVDGDNLAHNHETPSGTGNCQGVYSSIDDDEFSESIRRPDTCKERPLKSHEKLEAQFAPAQPTAEHDLSDSITFSQNSDEDEAFANLNLDFPHMNHDQAIGRCRNQEQISSPEPFAAKNESPADHDHFSSRSADVITIVRNEEVMDVVDDFPLPDLRIPGANTSSGSREVPGAKVTSKFRFDNSIWDSLNEPNDDDDDEQIRSFYSNKSVSSLDATLFQDNKTQDEKASPVNNVLTPQSADEILSFYSSESPVSGSDVEPELSSQKSSLAVRKLSDGVRSNGSSPGSAEPDVLHSTPQSARKKKSPSPTYTPIIKKLMLKKMSKKDSCSKSRISSRRFQSVPFLTDIKEEEERKDDAGTNVSMKLSLNTSNEKKDVDQKSSDNSRSSCNDGSGQIDVTLANTFGFRMNLENLQDVKTEVQHQFITVMSMEIFTTTRGDLNPDPEYDPVCGLFYSIFHDDSSPTKLISGVIIVADGSYMSDIVQFNCDKVFVKNEDELLDSFIRLIRKWDPDMFVGYEVEMLSWGYLIQRGQFLGRNYDQELSRLRETTEEIPKDRTIVDDSDYSDDLKLVGRIVLNVWRLMRHEIALQSYSFENMIFHILHQRVPRHSFRTLTEWWRNSLRRWIVIDYYLMRAESNISLLQQLDFIGRTSELAKLFGIQFYEVLSRGSQFRVESMMLRLAKTRNFVAVSPSTKQRAAMRAPESLPLIMEPESKFYTDPVIVLDFQSLYPSIIIAYNYCFSTCLGRVEYLAENDNFKFGCLQHTVPVDVLKKLESSLNISPCGVAFVNKNIRTGVLPTMLQEILDTRLMVKKSMKENKENSSLQRVLHARQLGLKLIANVTYGYTSANFSGRMPCIEVGDSVVSKGRETLERVIEMVTNTEKWQARVIYGDTDSLFVLVPNRTKEEAFRIGAEIADAATNANPKPVKLKLEKVYYPCILQTKKRYVGYMYESPDQKQPVYDAKGIETVRRDGCPAVSKILEKSLKLLFDRKAVDVIKQYVQRQFSKLISNRLSIQELTFAREYRGLKNYKPAACVPALQLARQAVLRDRRSEPRVKERVRYVLTAGPPGVPLIRSVRTPQQFLDTPGSIINAEYYITRVIIPALERCFSLLNVDVRHWYAELPRKQKFYLPVQNDIRNKAYKKKTISHYFAASKCVACEDTAIAGVCKECQKNPQRLALVLGNIVNSLQRKYNYVEKICRSCCGRNDSVECSSLDCPHYYTYRKTMRDIEQVPHLEELQQTFLRR